MATNAWRDELHDAAKRLKLRRRFAAAMVLAGAAVILGVLYSLFGPTVLLLAGGALFILFGIAVLSE